MTAPTGRLRQAALNGLLSGITVAVPTMPTAEEILANMRRLLDQIPRPVIVCHPDVEQQMAEAIARIPWPLRQPEIVTDPHLPAGQAIYIADARAFPPNSNDYPDGL